MRDRSEKAKPARGHWVIRRFSQAQSERIKPGIICFLLATVVWLAFGQTLRHDFIDFDDAQYVTENVHVLNGLNWPDVKWAFTTGHSGNFHPVTWLTHQLDCQLYGTWAGGHHLTSVVIHTVNSLLLFLLFWRTTRALWPSAFVAAVFAIHPLHVESVAWVAERKDVLSGLFFLLMLHAYAAYAAKPQAWRYLLTLCLFALGILSKPMLVTVPCLLLLFDYWPLRRMSVSASKREEPGRLSFGRLILEKVPFALIAASWSPLTFVIQKKFGNVADETHFGLALRIANALVSYVMYLWNTFWPHDLALFYPHPQALASGTVVFSVVLLVLVSVFCIAKRRSSPYLIIGWLWYLGMLVPVIGFIQVGQQARADRYTYLPQIGLCVLAAWGATELFAKWRRGHEVLSVIALATIAGLTALSSLQASHWQNRETVWRRSLSCTSNNYFAHTNLGKMLMQKGQVDEAVDHFRKAVEICDACAGIHNNLGHALSRQGNWADAITSYRAAIRTWPDSPNAHNNNNLGIALAQVGKTDEAIEQFQKALQIDGEYGEAHGNLAILLLRLGRRDEAVAHFREALRLKPDDANVKAQLRQLGVEE